MKISEEFKLARKLIESDKREYICHALQQVAKKKINGCYETKAMKVIQNRLGAYHSLDSWVISKVGGKKWCSSKTKTMKATRLAWLDSLIAEFEAKGE